MKLIIFLEIILILGATRFYRTSGILFSEENKDEKINLFIPPVSTKELFRIKKKQIQLTAGRKPPVCGEEGDYVLCRCPKTGGVRVATPYRNSGTMGTNN